jgi:hypothetical protein
MQVYVNGRAVELAPGMKVRHALLGVGIQGREQEEFLVTDAWGNEIGLDGAVYPEMKITLTRKK